MAVGDREAAFCRAAADDGVRLVKGSVPYVNQRGHFGLPTRSPEWARDALERILIALDGDPAVLSEGRSTPLPGDFVHKGTGRLVEFDEMQHFTSWRSRGLGLYPEQALLGFEPETYLGLCYQWSPKADRYRATKSARGFGPSGRQRQRAYYDALRDLGSAGQGSGVCTIRCDAADQTEPGAAVWERHRARVVQLLSES